MKVIKLQAHAMDLAASVAGDASKRALILLHGWPQSRTIYDGVVDRLGAEFFTLAFDLPQIGDSRGAPPSAEKSVLADVLLTAAESAGARDIVIAGFDVGGMIAYAAARDHATRIRGAVVMNTVIPGLDPWEKLRADPRIFHFALHNVPNLPETLVTGRLRPYFDFFFDVMATAPEAINDSVRAASAAAYERPEALTAGFDWYRAFAADAKRNAERKSITTPILYLRGDADGRSPEDYIPGIKAAGAAKVEGGVLPRSGEFAPIEAPDAMIDFIRAFASRL